MAHPRPAPGARDLPNLQALIDRGQKSVLKSTVPTHSWAAWPSFLTGVDPADHGVYDILETVPGTHKAYPVTYKSIKERTFLADLTAAGKQQLLLDVPLTFPPPDITGNLIAGGVLPKGRSVSYPADLQDTLQKAGLEWPINGMSWTTYRNRPDAYLDEALAVTGKRIKASEWLMDNTEWDLFATVWVSVDRTQHCLSNYVAPDHPDFAKNTTPRSAPRRAASTSSSTTRSARSCRAPSPTTWSVHQRPRVPELHARAAHGPPAAPVRLPGVLGLEHDLRPDAVGTGAQRRAQGVRPARPARQGRLPQSVNWAKTQAYTTIRSTGEGVSINLAGRDVDGIVDPADFERVRGEVMDRLASFVDPKTGKKPVKAIYKREDVFKGKHADTAPDILMEPNEGYSLTHAKSAIEDADWVSGDHRMDGVIVAAGPAVTPFTTTPYLIDMAPTMLAALDAPAGIRHAARSSRTSSAPRRP